MALKRLINPSPRRATMSNIPLKASCKFLLPLSDNFIFDVRSPTAFEKEITSSALKLRNTLANAFPTGLNTERSPFATFFTPSTQ